MFGGPGSLEFAFYETDREGDPVSLLPGDTLPFGVIQPALESLPRRATRPSADPRRSGPGRGRPPVPSTRGGVPRLERQVQMDLGFVPLAFEGVWYEPPPS